MEEITDPTGKLTELAYAARDPAVADPADPDHEHACASLVYALGDCRLFALDPGADNGTLPPAVALAAATEITAQLGGLAQQARELGEAWDESPEGCEELALDLLVARRDGWAASIVLDEAARQARAKAGVDDRSHRGILATDLETAISGFNAALAEFDAALWGQLDLLSGLAEAGELANDRTMLSRSPHGSPLPWWLDGTLEKRAEAIRQK